MKNIKNFNLEKKQKKQYQWEGQNRDWAQGVFYPKLFLWLIIVRTVLRQAVADEPSVKSHLFSGMKGVLKEGLS